MTKQTINYGAAGSGSGGDTARTALQKLEANFNEIFSSAGSAANAKALNELAGEADRLPYFSGAGAISLTAITARSRAMLAYAEQIGLLGPTITTPSGNANDCTVGTIQSANGTADQYATYNWPNVGGSLPVWWNFFTFGADTRRSQFAVHAFNTYGTRLFLRRRHDSDWSEWDEALTSANAAALPISTALAASVDNARTMGTAALRWSTVYAGTGTINTSDAREKTEVRVLTDGEISAARQLAQEIGAYKFLAAVTEKGTDAREHIGLTVQRAIEVLQANGLEPFNYGFICYDSWPQATVDHPATYEQVPVTDADGNVIGYENGALIKEAWTEVTQEEGDRYSFRTDELNLFIARGQAAYLAQLEARIAALEPAA